MWLTRQPNPPCSLQTTKKQWIQAEAKDNDESHITFKLPLKKIVIEAMKNYSPNCGVSVRNQSVFIFLRVRHKGKRKITALFVKCTAKSIVLMLMQEKQNFNRRSTGVSRTQPTVLQSSLSDISLFQTQLHTEKLAYQALMNGDINFVVIR